MADTKISLLTNLATLGDDDEFAVNDAGVSKKVLASVIRAYLKAASAPSIVSVGAEFSSTGTPTATLPGTHATDDILGLVIHTSNQAFTTPVGYNRIGPANGIGAAATAGSIRMYLFWKRDGGAESAPTLSDSGDHTYGFMFAVRGCVTSGDPFVFGGNFWKFATSTSAVGPNSRADRANCLITDFFAHGVDNATGQLSGSATNSDLTSLTTQFNDSTTDGFGGGLVMISGVRTGPGFIAGTTFTWSNTTVEVSSRVHWIPASDLSQVVYGVPTVEYFIGSAPDLDDVWNKPTGAKKIFAQLIDGGGGGSGGNTTGTAEGGGGGGGGGYDEAWYDANDLGATVTLHPGKGGDAGTALGQAGNVGVLSFFDSLGPLANTKRITGIAATAAATGDGGNGGSGSGAGTTSPAVQTTRLDAFGTNAARPTQGQGGAGGSGTTAPTGGGNADWGGGGGESGGDTDAAITAINNGWSKRGAGGGSGGRTNTTISQPGHGGGVAATFAAQGAEGAASTRLPYGGAGGVGGGSSVVTGGAGGFPGGGGGGGAGVAGGFGGRGGHGIVAVTTFF